MITRVAITRRGALGDLIAPFTTKDTVYCTGDPEKAPYFVCKVIYLQGKWLMWIGLWRWTDMDNIEEKCTLVECEQFKRYT